MPKATETTETAASPAEDRLEGVEAIAEFVGLEKRACEYRLNRGQIPHGREGRHYVASKRVLAEHWRRMTEPAVEAAE